MLLRIGVATTVVLFSLVDPATAGNAPAATRRHTDIPAQSLGSALTTLAKERGLQLIYRSELVAGRRAARVSGDLTLAEALSAVLAGSGLTYRYLNDDTITIAQLPTENRRADVSENSTPMIHGRWRMLGYALALLTAGGPGVAQTAAAQDAATGASTQDSQGQLQEIVVTATKQAEDISKVPMSIAAYTRDTLDKQNISTFEDIAKMTPGVTFSAIGTHRSDLSIRGISAGSGTATTGVYIDDTPVQIRPDCCVSSNPYPRIFDLERVEILRGPQGTLYGAGSMGGTIRFITPEPNLRNTRVYARAETAFTERGDPTQEAGLAVGTPIVDGTVGFYGSAYYRREGGYVDHIDRYDQSLQTSNANWDDALALRTALKFAPNDNLAITPSIFYQREKTGDSSFYWEAFSNPDKGQYNNANPVVTPSNDSFILPALKIDWHNDVVALVSNTSYLDRRNVITNDDTLITTAIFAGITGPSIPEELSHVAMPGAMFSGQQLFTQEVRLQNANPDSRLRWVTGVFYQHVNQSYHYFIDAHQLPEVLNYGNSGPPITVADALGVDLYNGKYMLYDFEKLRNDEIALYGNVDFRITDKWSATAGLRYSHNTFKDAEFEAGPIVSSADGFWVESKTTDKPITPKFGVSYQVTDNSMAYLTAAKGYRQGFHTGQVATRCAADLAALGVSGASHEVKSDSVWNYEIGSKNRLLDGRMQLDASIYRIDWTDIQSSLGLTCGNTWRGNLGKARSQGFDLNFADRIARHLTLGLAVGYADAAYTQSVFGAPDPITGKAPVLRPKGEPLDIAPWTVVSSVQYDFNWFGRSGYVRADHRYTSHDSTPLPLEVSGTDPTIMRDPSSNNLDMRIGMQFGAVEMSVFGSNLTNQHPEFARNRTASWVPPEGSLYTGLTVRPRTFGVTAIYRM